MSPRQSPLLVVVGDTAFDYYVHLDGSDAPDEKLIPRNTARMLGGTGANAAAAAARLGSRVDLLTVVGDDPTGAWLTERLRETGIGTQGVRVVAGTSTVATILLTGERRTVIVDVGVGRGLVQFSPAAVSGADLIYISYSPQAVVIAVDSGLGNRTVVGLEAWMLEEPGLLERLPQSRLVITNQAGWAAFSQHDGARSCETVETRGALGARIHSRDGQTEDIAAIKVNAVDATGAGDAFAGALCHYLGIGHELADAAQLACIVAGLATRAIGAQSSLPDNAVVKGTALELRQPSPRH